MRKLRGSHAQIDSTIEETSHKKHLGVIFRGDCSG